MRFGVPAQDELSREYLNVRLTDRHGRPADAFSVTWTVYTASGAVVSGVSIPAVRRSTGVYYAPWESGVEGGSHRIEWSVTHLSGQPSKVFSQDFFVNSWASYTPCGLIPSVTVGPGAFKAGQQLVRGDLPLFIRGDDGLLRDAHAVFWTVYDGRGCALSLRSAAIRAAVGEYYAPWLVQSCHGDHKVVWEFQADSSAPFKSVSQGFYVVSLTAPASL